ncbi:uncharacterized protein LOC125013809 [Mugil cephalus]|uniref:uncharacterized protein LOC125013809 n=1 Tax=Mugil cephalus TaxID=48193 RepID=UPI001FB63642|nr:uncharacterized protein LOC125013809 [Mugil cephalus]
MLKPQQQQPQQHQGELLLRDSPPVFGKPWYWQRSTSAMESSRSLAQVIMEMRDEIKKLEAENRELRGDYGQRSFGAVPGEGNATTSAAKQQPGMEENPYVNLRRNASAPVLEGQYRENAVMTVRRYSTSSNLSAVAMREGRIDSGWHGNSRWGRLQEEIHHVNGELDNSAKGDVGKVTNRHSLQEYVHKNRSKVKTVTFLLPVDDIYTSRPVLTKNQKEPNTMDLASTSETNS